MGEKEQAEITEIFRCMLAGRHFNSVLDLGAASHDKNYYYKGLFKNTKYISADADKSADIVVDFNKMQRLKLKSKPLKPRSFDLVIASMILEHVFNLFPLIKEINRISKKYILIGLPNAYAFDNRLLMLFGMNKSYHNLSAYFGHHHFCSVRFADDLVKNYFKDFSITDKKFRWGSTGGSLLPERIRFLLANKLPTSFATDIYYLLERRKR